MTREGWIKNEGKVKASAAATISKYVPIGVHSQTSSNSINQGGFNGCNIDVSSKTYFESFIKKKSE